jgi:hypothetical protein
MAASIFDHLAAIYLNKKVDYLDTLEEPDRKTFNTYMINRFISMNADYLPVVNAFQKFYGVLGPRETYLFYSQFLPRKKAFAKYVKGVKEEKYDEWLVDIVVRYFEVSKKDAISYLDLFYQTEEGKADLREICEFFGTDPKKIKKVKI